jgi:hypothetical protein
MTKLSFDELRPMIIEALRGNVHQHFSIIWKSDKQRGFLGDGDQTPALVQFMQLHQERLIRELKHAAVALHWNDGDKHAVVTLVSQKLGHNEPFPQFTLPFPSPKPALV